MFSDVLFSYLFTHQQLKRVVLVVTYTRPCAEGFGIFRLMLYQVAKTPPKSAYFYGYYLQPS